MINANRYISTRLDKLSLNIAEDLLVRSWNCFQSVLISSLYLIFRKTSAGLEDLTQAFSKGGPPELE
jgi:hypothetical protein